MAELKYKEEYISKESLINVLDELIEENSIGNVTHYDIIFKKLSKKVYKNGN